MNITRPQDPPDGQPIGMDWWGKGEWGCDWRKDLFVISHLAFFIYHL